MTSISDIQVPITDPIPPQFPRRDDHPFKGIGIESSRRGPVQTNKFYANLFLGNQNNGVWTHPYSISWARGAENPTSWGMAMSHIEENQLAFGPGDPSQYYINPIGIRHFILSATELGSSTALTTSKFSAFSVNVDLSSRPGTSALITFPLLQGMGFLTGIYKGSTPILQSAVFFRNFTFVEASGALSKYRVILEDNNEWLLYVSSVVGNTRPNFLLQNNSTIQGPSGFQGIVQVAKRPRGPDSETILDKAAGAYPVAGDIGASGEGGRGSYSFMWEKEGDRDRPLLMYALPHHVQSFDEETKKAASGSQLRTTVKGLATAVLSDKWTLEENLPEDLGFAPWTPEQRSITSLSSGVVAKVESAGATELDQDINSQTNLDSMYFSGKALGKFAAIVYAITTFTGNASLAQNGLAKLKAALAVFVENRQTYPLVYDEYWKGVTSSASYVTGDPGQDFGNTYYNDHHFHFGYFVYTAAVISQIDKSWLSEGTNRAWVNTLIRDFANPSSRDIDFPFSRSFDWYNGHSWAKGLFDSADGKDQESSSEDAFASYALKMWGRATGDANQELRGSLMLAIQARSLQHYYLMESDNTVHPPNFIGNKAVGILFDNKVDHTTYFGNQPEFIEGIHMIPINPSSTLTRTKKFVREEWDIYFSNGRVENVQADWRALLYGNFGIINPRAAYDFFAQDNFDYGTLDGGASRTWYLTLMAGFGNIQL